MPLRLPALLRLASTTLILGFVALVPNLGAWTSHQLHERMGRGINYGNYYNSQRERTDLAPIPRAHFDAIRDAGFSHVRIPVTWGYRMYFPSGPTGSPAVKSAFLASVKTSVDNAIDAGLLVVLNSHHERWFQYYWAAKGDALDIRLRESGVEPFSGTTPAPWDYVPRDRALGGRKASEIYQALYAQLAQTFNTPKYDVLIFEGLNEPMKQVPDKDADGTLIDAFPFNSTGSARVNAVNAMLFATLQDHYQPSHGARRTYMMTVRDMNNALSFRFLTMPAYGDWSAAQRRERLMITLHFYYSGAWTHYDTPSQNTWGSTSDYDHLLTRMDMIDSSVPANFEQPSSPLVGTPVNIGEFGIAHRHCEGRDSDDVLEWYRAVSAAAQERNLSATVWCDNGWFRVFNRAAGTFHHPAQPDYVSEIWKQVVLFENRWRLVSKADPAHRLAVDAVANYQKWRLRPAAPGDGQVFTFEVDPQARLDARDRIKYPALRNENGAPAGRFIDLAQNSFATGTPVQSSTLPLDTALDHYVYPSFEDGTGSIRLVTRLGQQEYPETPAGDMVVAAPDGPDSVAVLRPRAAHDNQRWVLEQAP